MKKGLTTSTHHSPAAASTVEGGADEVLRHRNREEHSAGLQDAHGLLHVGHGIQFAFLIVFGVNGIETRLRMSTVEHSPPCR